MQKRTQAHVAALLSIAVLVLSLLFPFVSRAEGTTTIFFSNASPAVGDTVRVTVQGSAADTITVAYSASFLTIQSCSAAGASVAAGRVTFSGTNATLVLTASSAGTADFIVSATSLAGCSAKMNIRGQSAGQNTASAGENASSAGENSASNGQNQTPSDAAETTPGTSTDSTGTAENPGSSEQPAENETSKRIGDEDTYVDLQTPVSVPSVLAETNVQAGDAEVPAYIVSGSTSGIYYVYGTDQNGNTGWFSYDGTTGVLMRADEALLSLASENSGSASENQENEPKDDKPAAEQETFQARVLSGLREIFSHPVTAGAVILILIAVLVIIIALAKLFSSDRKDDDIFDAEDEDNPEPDQDTPELSPSDRFEQQADRTEDAEEQAEEEQQDGTETGADTVSAAEEQKYEELLKEAMHAGENADKNDRNDSTGGMMDLNNM